jgi:serine protein kinase
MNYIGALAIDGKKFDYAPTSACIARSNRSSSKTRRTRSSSRASCNVVDKETQEKIEVVKSA